MKFKRFSAALLAVLCLTAGCQTKKTAAETSGAETAARTPMEAIAELFQPEPKVSEDALVFLACSDLQHSSGHETAVQSVKAILGEIRDAGYDHADGAFFCGGVCNCRFLQKEFVSNIFSEKNAENKHCRY